MLRSVVMRENGYKVVFPLICMGFAGIDRGDYPGDDNMDWLKANTNLVWTGFYLPSPCHGTSNWIGQSTNDTTKTIYQYLLDSGWGLPALYVGQQDPSITRCPANAHDLTDDRGAADAQDAASQASSAGFPNGSVIYLDVEQGGLLTAANLGYVTAWITSLPSTPFNPGVYCSYLQTADQIKQAVNAIDSSLNVKFWVWHLYGAPGTCPTISNNTYPSDDPPGSGVSYASVWQVAQCCTIQVAGSSFTPIDFDTADSANPSAP